jgi:HAD superfamily hydrolase (TIGR01509 family)
LIEAIVFDFDGLIFDTEIPIFQSWQEVYQSFGLELTLDDWQHFIGTSDGSFQPKTALESRLGHRINWNILEHQREQRELELIDQREIRPGVMDYLHDAQNKGLKLGLASSSPHSWVDFHLQRLNLYNYFQSIQCADDVVLTKPDPALYLQAVQGIGVAPDTAIALEDSPAGALAAQRAGLFCVVVPNDITRNLTFSAGDLVLNSLADLKLADLLDLVNSKHGRNGRLK